MITPALIREIRRGYRLPWRGLHGVLHWARVLENGLRLATSTWACREVVALFAVFHDTRRLNEDYDPEHGRRGAELAATLRGKEFDLADAEFELLRTACIHHTDGLTEAEVTVQTCWDADRLDLGRVGMKPHPRYLCTSAAKRDDVIAWAYGRSLRGHESKAVAEWDDATRHVGEEWIARIQAGASEPPPA